MNLMISKLSYSCSIQGLKMWVHCWNQTGGLSVENLNPRCDFGCVWVR